MKPLLGVLVVVAANSLGCGSKAADPQGDNRVPECDAYAAQVGVCFGREAPPAEHAVAQAAALSVADEGQRARMKAACIRDLERLKTSCH